MRRSRSITALLLALLLLLSLTSGASATPAGSPAKPWSSPTDIEWYTVLSTETTATGRPTSERFHFYMEATTARLTVANEGILFLDARVNGQRVYLLSAAAGGTAHFDLTGLVRWGENELELRSWGYGRARASVTVEAPVFTVRLLHMNDNHAKIDPLPKVAAYVKAARAEGTELYFINAGDIFSGGPVSDLNQGLPMIALLNAMGLDLLAMGNHDFDHGPAATQARREASRFPWLSANTLVADASATPIEPFEAGMIFSNELGQRIAFVALTQTPPATAAKNVVGLQFADPVEVAKAYVQELRSEVNLLVIISHNGHDFDKAMAAQLTGVDLILGGHTHTNLSKPEVVNGIPIMQAGSDSRFISDLVLRKEGSEVGLFGAGPGGASRVTVADLTEVDAAVQAIADMWNERMAATLKVTIGSTAVALDRDTRYAMDSNLGNLITDAMAWYMETDIAFTNNGGIRASIPAGAISMEDVYTVLPFGNWVVSLTLTGEQLEEVVRYSYTRRNQLDLQTSGLSYVIYTKPNSTELERLEIFVGGQPLDPKKRYTVAVPDFIGAGGSGYPFPKMAPVNDQSADVDAIIVGEFIRVMGKLDYPQTEGRIQIKQTEPAEVPAP